MTPFVVIDDSPAQTQKRRELFRAKARAHAARHGHERRRIGLIRKVIDVPLGWRQYGSPMIETGPATRSGSEPSSNDSWRSPSSSPEDESMLVDYRPSQRPGWNHTQLEDFQFYLDVLGSSLKGYSLDGFFNIVVPCLAEYNFGIRTLLLAVAAMHRTFVAPRDADRLRAELEALERFEDAIQQLAIQAKHAPPEVLQTSCVLLACWHTLRLDTKAAGNCVRVAQRMCHLNSQQRLESRLISARNATDPQAVINYRLSSFATILRGTVAKWMLEFPSTVYDLDENQRTVSHSLSFDSLLLTHPITDFHDILSAMENLISICTQLVSNIRADAYIDRDSMLAVDLSTRCYELKALLDNTDAAKAELTFALDTFRCFRILLQIIIHCQLLSNSMIVFDEYTADFREIVNLAQRWMSSSQPESFVYAPTMTFAQPLWYTAVCCRDPYVRRKAIAVLRSYHRNECGLDTWCAAHVATQLMEIEENNADIRSASNVAERRRVLLEGFEYRNGETLLRYVYNMHTSDNTGVFDHTLAIPPDLNGVMNMKRPLNDVEHLNRLLMLVSQAYSEVARGGCVCPVLYGGDTVRIIVF